MEHPSDGIRLQHNVRLAVLFRYGGASELEWDRHHRSLMIAARKPLSRRQRSTPDPAGQALATWARSARPQDCAEERFTAKSMSRSGKISGRRHMSGQQDRRSTVVHDVHGPQQQF
jgi:hypothetical protein